MAVYATCDIMVMQRHVVHGTDAVWAPPRPWLLLLLARLADPAMHGIVAGAGCHAIVPAALTLLAPIPALPQRATMRPFTHSHSAAHGQHPEPRSSLPRRRAGAEHVTHNEALRVLDAVVQLGVLDKDLATPPGSPAEGDRYIVAASPTGAWAGHAGSIAVWQDGAWAFHAPRAGWLAWVADEDKLYAYSGTAWAEFTSPGAGAPVWGVNTTADTTDRFAVKSISSLFDNVGSGHRQKVNKAAAGDTASTLYQTASSGRAELGLTGDDDFHVKVSADGSAWTEALAIDRASGAVDVKGSLRAQDHLVGTQATGPRVVAVGDSLTLGTGASAPYTSLITYPTWNGQTLTVSNIGVAGRFLRDMARLAYTNLNPLFANESGLNVAVVWGGINDLASLGATPEDTYSRLRAFCGRLRSLGWRVVVCTLVSRVAFDTERATFNGYVRGNWPLFADALADLGANASIGAAGAYANVTYFQGDGIHLTDAGLVIVAGLVQAELTTLAQGTPNWFAPFGNVGIGTSAPSVALHVRKAGFPAVRAESTDNTTSSAAALTAAADWGQVQFAGHCSARTVSRFGVHARRMGGDAGPERRRFHQWADHRRAARRTGDLRHQQCGACAHRCIGQLRHRHRVARRAPRRERARACQVLYRCHAPQRRCRGRPDHPCLRRVGRRRARLQRRHELAPRHGPRRRLLTPCPSTSNATSSRARGDPRKSPYHAPGRWRRSPDPCRR
jgi:lysophospholipase L1-like esterase